jgi:sterol desaturase/sphingolipid hydroxylase (fatty acid hydroxylase superfamily)
MEGVLAWLRATYDPSTLAWAWGGIALSLGAFHFVELLFPAEQSQRYRAVGFNAIAGLVFLVLTPLASYLPGHIAVDLTRICGGPLFDISLSDFVTDNHPALRVLSLAVLAFVPLLVFDFFYYWFHRLQHVSRWLWEQHKLHHTDDALNVTTSLRSHWTEMAFRSILISIPMGMLFKITPVDAGIVTMFIGQWGYLIHANIRLPLGPLTPILCGPQAHRIHHSILPKHANHNFAAFFPIWDILFGTFYHPRRNEFPPLASLANHRSHP